MRWICCFLIVIFLQGCYTEQEINPQTVQGIWRVQDYDKLKFSSQLEVLMLELDGDRITFYFNQNNLAYRFTYEDLASEILLTAQTIPREWKQNTYKLSNGEFRIRGELFNGRRIYDQSDIEHLEVHKAEYLFTEYGRWQGVNNSRFFELVENGFGVHVLGESFAYVHVVEQNGKKVIELIDGDNLETWDYSVQRNKLVIGLPNGVAEFRRVLLDGIQDLD
jgi:hypothetical protein